jgi:hypothetical protein
MKGFFLLARIVLLLASACLAGNAGAESLLYVTSIRTLYENDVAQIECNLYRVDASTGAATLLGPMRLGGTAPVAVISLAIHPATGVVYGITAGLAGNVPRSLVTVDPASGNVTRVGPLGQVASDLAFARDGALYAWLPQINRLARIDLGTGAAAPLADSGITGLMGGGFAIDNKGNGIIAATGAVGTIDTIDIQTGRGTTGPQLEGAPYISAITNLSFGPDGRLYGVNSNMGAPASTALVLIDPATGKVRELSKLPHDSHGLIFASEGMGGLGINAMHLAAMVVGAIVILVVIAVLVRRRRH